MAAAGAPSLCCCLTCCRWALRGSNALLPSFRQGQPASQLFTSPLRISPELQHLVLARGDRKAAAALAVLERTAAGSSQPGQLVVPAALSSSGLAALAPDAALQQMRAALMGSSAAAPQDFWRAFSYASGCASTFDSAVAAAFAQGLIALWQGLDADKTSAPPLQLEQAWLVGGLAQVQVHEAASSPEVAAALLGLGGLQAEQLR